MIKQTIAFIKNTKISWRNSFTFPNKPYQKIIYRSALKKYAAQIDFVTKIVRAENFLALRLTV